MPDATVRCLRRRSALLVTLVFILSAKSRASNPRSNRKTRVGMIRSALLRGRSSTYSNRSRMFSHQDERTSRALIYIKIQLKGKKHVYSILKPRTGCQCSRHFTRLVLRGGNMRTSQGCTRLYCKLILRVGLLRYYSLFYILRHFEAFDGPFQPV